MKLPFWPFTRAKRRHARYVLDVTKLGLEATSALIDVLKQFTPVISAGQWNKLTPSQKALFVRAGK